MLKPSKKWKKKTKKTLGVKGKFSGKMIDKLTVYYGSAIRRNCDHYCTTDENPQHDKCPIGPESWCFWQQAAAANELSEIKNDHQPLPEDVAEAVRPICTDLNNEKLLERCVGGFTQNSNES